MRSIDKAFMTKSLQEDSKKQKGYIINNYATLLKGFMDAMSGATKGMNILIYSQSKSPDGGRGDQRPQRPPSNINPFTAHKFLYKGGPMTTGLFQFDRGRCGEDEETLSCFQKKRAGWSKAGQSGRSKESHATPTATNALTVILDAVVNEICSHSRQKKC
ncbi:MAG: hypothetical protein Q7J98_10905 [Kiritimatiellia bacterium]|nr:hypothetical protein [Kiritimatiellia bacterium]